MKKITILFLLLGFIGFAQVTTVPSPVLADQPVTIYFDKAGTNLASYTGTIYAHTGLTVDGTDWSNVIGSWGSNAQPSLTLVSGTTYKLEIPTNLYTFYNVPTSSTITKMWFVFRAAGSSGPQTNPDISVNVGAFQVNMGTPAADSTTILNSGASLNITASNTGGPANYNLMSNGVSINTANSVSTFTYNHTNLTANQNYELVVTQGTNVITKSFTAIVNPNTTSAALPAGMRDGINYHTGDASKVTLVLNAPGKDFVYVAGSFNNWHPTSAYAMKREPGNGKFWLELPYTFVAGNDHSFQYWVVDQTPFTNSPALVKTADPFSTLVLSPYDDEWIEDADYPNMPEYPTGQSFEVSVIKTGQTPYNWQVPNFTKPEKEDLIIYELLIRDFNEQKTWQSLIDQFGYLQTLNINAIELMPIMEFEGNISWGYNTAYHMAPDKAYGPAESMKEFIDMCHQNGIAVILDVALNHVYGRSPLARMWVNDPDGDGFGNTTTENPYCNVTATHSYSVGTDLNHQQPLTQYYVQRTIEHWITEFKIDGFRWDLTKGFTQNCTNNEACTNNYQADRVAILKTYADMQWAIDPNFYVIFEHMGTGSGSGSSAGEETEWANYRVGEGKGIMLWGKLTDAYNQNTMGFSSNSNFNSMDFENRGYQQPRLVGFAESHDEERLMYKNLEYGASAGSYNVQDLATALERQKALGAVFLTVPGPKMIWQFGELGYDFSINRCENGSINNDCRTNPKPIPFTLGYHNDMDRMSLKAAWANILDLRRLNPVFHTNTFTIASGNLLPRIDIWNESISTTMLRNVIVLANFNTTAQPVNTNFPLAGTWYNLIDNTTIESTVTSITLQPGEYRIFGNQPPIVTGNEEFTSAKIALYPNPANSQFSLSTAAEKVEVYTITGQLVKSFGAAEAGTSFDVDSLGNGMYLVKITDAANRQSTAKLIKE